MLNKEMVQFFESILEERSDEFRVTESDLVSPSAFEKKQAKIRRKVVELLRLREVGARFGMQRLDEEMHVISLPVPDVQVLDRVSCEGYTREHWLMETLPGIHMPMYVLIPDEMDRTVPHPCILAAHGHGPGKDSVCGTSPVPEVLARMKERGGCYGEIMAQQGYMVFAPDMWGFGERRIHDDAKYGERWAFPAAESRRSIPQHWMSELSGDMPEDTCISSRAACCIIICVPVILFQISSKPWS